MGNVTLSQVRVEQEAKLLMARMEAKKNKRNLALFLFKCPFSCFEYEVKCWGVTLQNTLTFLPLLPPFNANYAY